MPEFNEFLHHHRFSGMYGIVPRYISANDNRLCLYICHKSRTIIFCDGNDLIDRGVSEYL